MKNRTGRMGRKLGSLLGVASRRGRLHRALRAESLEARQVMAGDVYLPYHNDLIPADTNYDYTVSALDALLVINAINGGRLGALSTAGAGKADGPLVDVSGDNNLTPLDALKVINSLNAEGVQSPIVGFTYQLTDINGTGLVNNQASVGQTVQLRASLQDLRSGFGNSAQGVFAAFLDLDYSNASNFQVQVGETQSFRYFYDQLLTNPATSNFKFTFGSEKTGAVSLFKSSGGQLTPRSPEEMAAAIQAALESLSSIGVGNVSVKIDQVSTADDVAAGTPRNSFDITFRNAKAGQDVPLLVLDASAVLVQPGQTFNFSLTDKYPADPSNPNSFASAFVFTDEFSVGRTATNTAGVFDEVGASQGLGSQTDAAGVHAFFTVTLKALQPGTVTFTPNAADLLPAHDVLVRPKDVVPSSLVNYGNPFTLTIVNELTANPDSFTAAEDAAVAAYDVTANDQLLVGTSFIISSVTPSTAGVIPTISTDKKKINYKPAPNFFGTDTFTYTILSDRGVTSTATVTMNITAVNDPISVPNQTAATNLGKAIALTAADLTVGGSVGPANEVSIQQLSIASVVGSTSAKGGTVVLNNGVITYTPPVGFPTTPNPNTDTFRFVVTDNGLTNGQPDPKSQTVTATVTVTNDQPTAVNDSYPAVIEEQAFVMTVLDNDSAGAQDIDSLVIASTGGTPQGTVTIAGDKKSITYTPKAGFIGSDAFTYTVRDLGGLISVASVSVNVIPARLPSALPDSATVAEDTVAGVEINVLANDRVSAGATKQIDSFQQPSVGGTVSQLQNGNLKFVPAPDFFGTATFSYTMSQSPIIGDGPSTTSVVVTVTPVNDAPVLVDDVFDGTEDIPVEILLAALLTNDNAGPGESSQVLTVTGVQAVTQNAGAVAIVGNKVVYTPAADFNGPFVFKYTARDNGVPALSSEAFVSVTMAPVNDAPIANSDPAVGSEAATTTPEDTGLTIQSSVLLLNDKAGPVTALDEVGQVLSIQSVSGASAKGGTVALSQDKQSIVYTPAANFFGDDTFTYVLVDNGVPPQTATGVVTVRVTEVNDTPIVQDDSLIAFKDAPLVIVPNKTLFTNDAPGPANEAFQTLTVKSVFNATHGTVNIVNGQVIFTPDAGYLGPAEFYYTAEDNGQTAGQDDFKSATGKVSIEVKDFLPSNISGTVYVDENNNGLVDSTERRLGAVEVVLTGKALGQDIEPISYTTAADGVYHFDNLAPGNYVVSFANPTLMLDGKDSAGLLGDFDGQANNNAFGINIEMPGDVDASGYNFGVIGYQSGFGSIIERLASRYYAAGSNLSTYGLYATLNGDGSMSSFAKLDGFSNVVFAEAVLINNGTEVVLTIVENDHSVYSALLGRGKFLSMIDAFGNTVIRVLGGREQLKFVQVDLAAPPTVNSTRYLDEVDAFFDQQGW